MPGEGDNNNNDNDRRDISDVVASFLARHQNDSARAVEVLLRENRALRRERRELREKLPATDAVILTGDEAAAWQKYKSLGTPDELTTKLGERDTFKTEAETLRRDGVLRDVAETAGFKFSVLKDLDAKAGGLTYEIAEEGEGDKKQKIVRVKDGDKVTPLADYAKANWGDYLPALKVEEQRQQGTPYPRQGTGGGNPKVDPLDAHLRKTYGPRQTTTAQGD